MPSPSNANLTREMIGLVKCAIYSVSSFLRSIYTRIVFYVKTWLIWIWIKITFSPHGHFSMLLVELFSVGCFFFEVIFYGDFYCSFVFSIYCWLLFFFFSVVVSASCFGCGLKLKFRKNTCKMYHLWKHWNQIRLQKVASLNPMSAKMPLVGSWFLILCPSAASK